MAILFRQDWLRYPTAIADYNTTNESFKRLVYLYKEIGIENAEFPLALMQPELSGVDPFAEDLTKEQKFKIGLEAKFNPWFFFREICRIPPNAGTVPIRFQANRGNIAMYWSFFNHVDFGLLQPRQTGKSVSTDCLMTGIEFLWAANTTVYLITKDNALRNNNIERLKEIRDLLPSYIFYPSPGDADNNEMLSNVAAGNYYKTAVGRNDRVGADKLGRGLTVPIVHFDELAYINLIECSLPVALSSGSAARDQAADAKQPYGNIYTTTAGNINSRDGSYAYSFMTGGVNWSESFYDLGGREDLVEMVDRHSTGQKPLIYGAFNHRQLGKTDEWLYRKLRETNSSGELADRDYFNIWTTGNEGTPLSPSEKRSVKESEQEPLYTEITPDGYVIRWFIPKEQIPMRMATGNYVMGIDPSEALGDKTDGTGLVVIDAVTHDTVFTGRYNETNLQRLGIFIANLLVRFPNLTLIPERKSSGTALLDTMFIHLPVKGVDPFKRIYNRIMDEPETLKTEFQEIQRPLGSRPSYFYDKYKKYFGFNTTGGGRHGRDALYGDALSSALRLGSKRVHDKTLVNELLTLTIKNGRIDHASGNHDDMVISWLLAHWFCTKARHLNAYGIDATRIFAEAVDNPAEMTHAEQFQRQQQQRYQAEFNALIEELKDTQDPMIIQKLEMKLRRLSTHIDVQETVGVGIDAMIKQAQEERSRKSKIQRYTSKAGKRIRFAA